MNEIDKSKITETTVSELAELGRQIPSSTRSDLIRRLDAVIGVPPQPRTVLLSH